MTEPLNDLEIATWTGRFKLYDDAELLSWWGRARGEPSAVDELCLAEIQRRNLAI